MIILTEKQKEVLKFIIRYKEEFGFPPTLREIGKNFNIKSTNAVTDHLIALGKKGYIERRERGSRAIKVLKERVEE